MEWFDFGVYGFVAYALGIVAIPSKAFRKVVQAVRPHLAPRQMLISMTKGIEANTFALIVPDFA